jgi:hypothetical protein
MNEATDCEVGVPRTIGYKTKELAPVLKKWRDRNPGVPWAYLIRAALKKELREIAGKRLSHLVES